MSYVALMDARSIAATALNGGVLTGADELPAPPADPAEEPFAYDDTPYKARVYFGVGRPDPGPGVGVRPQYRRLAGAGGPAGEPAAHGVLGHL